MLTRLLSGDLPRSRLSTALLLDLPRPGARAVPVPRRAPARTRGHDLRLHRAGGVLRPAARLHRHRLVRPHHVLRDRRLRRRPGAGTAGRRPGRRSRWASPSRWLSACVLALRDRAVRAARAGDLLRHDHAGGGVVVRGAGLAALRLHGRRGRRSPSACPKCCARLPLLENAVFGVAINGRSSPTTSCSSAALVLFLFLLRIVNSPFGRVLQAIRENEFRAEALGYRSVYLPHRGQLPRRAGGGAGRRADRRCGCATSGPTPRCRSRS